MEHIALDRLLIVRNDSSTNWESSTYILKKGEFGIGYIGPEEKQRAIVKIGNGVDLWVDLPTVDYTLPEDFIITYDFGRHKAGNSFVNAGGEGMLLSEWLQDALYQVRKPEVKYPDFSAEAKIKKYENEIGSRILDVEWKGEYFDAEYEFGTKTSSDKFVETDPIFSVSYHGEILGDTISGEARLETEVIVDSFEEKQYGEVLYHCAWGDAVHFPVNNIGEEVPERLVCHGEKEVILPIFAKGYREGCFYGPVNIENFDESKINHWVVRNLQHRLGAAYAGQKGLECQVPANTTAFLIAVPENETGPYKVINESAGVQMWDKNLFDCVVINVGGADSSEENEGKYAAPYKVFYYKPAYPYKNITHFTISLAE